MKVKKMYSLNCEIAKTINLATLNNTERAIIKTMYKISKEDLPAMCGNEILEEAVKRGLWTTKQDPSKYHTTWAYYVKDLKNYGVFESGSKLMGEAEFLED